MRPPVVPGLVVPRLGADVPVRLVTRTEPETIRLARRLLDAGVATPADWTYARREPRRFIALALQGFVARHGGGDVARRFDLTVELQERPGFYEDADVDGVYYLAVGSWSQSGFARMGKPLALLEAIHPRLPVTVYRELVGAVNLCGRVYDYQDAAETVEVMYSDMDPEDQKARPDINALVPEALGRQALSWATVRTLAMAERPATRRLLDGAIALHEVVQAETPTLRGWHRELPDEVWYGFEGPVNPTMFFCFEPDDAVCATFDQEFMHMDASGAEPALLLRFDVARPATVARAFARLAAATRVLAAAARLLQLLPGNRQYNFEPARQRPRTLADVLGDMERRTVRYEAARQGPIPTAFDAVADAVA